MIDSMLEVFAVGCPAALIYSYLIYPLLLFALAGLYQAIGDALFVMARIDRRQAMSAGCEEASLPKVAVVISAYNEERHIAARLHNLLSQDYPADKLAIYVASDGSTDRTAELIRAVRDTRLYVVVFDHNRGKASVLNDLVARASAQVLVFSDANTLFGAASLRRLVARLNDPKVGCVIGELRLRSSGGNNQDGLYWRVEQALKFFESRIGGSLGANGAVYAIRRETWTPLAGDTICDDFCVAMNVAAQRWRTVYEPAAWAEEETPADIGAEYARRVRIGTGNYQALVRHPEYLLRTSWATRFAYLSHKVLRWLGPHLFILGMAAGTLLWWRQGVAASQYLPTLVVAQAAALCIAAILYVVSELRARAGKRLPGILAIPAFLFALNLAFLVASWRAARGDYSGSWRRTAREVYE
jgi:cellulose synthase/poly-beta-1,6-N-acetylglucosamine synthase-like glycosyltransferase